MKLIETVAESINNEILSNFDLVYSSKVKIYKMNPKIDGKIVLCDRFHDSTVAYQGYGRGLNLESIESIINQRIKPYTPDLTFLLTISTKTIAHRLDQRKEQSVKDRLDIESQNFFERTAKGYQELASAEPERFVCLDGEQEIEYIHQKIISELKIRFSIG